MTGSTLIHTETGLRPIQSLVGTSGKVYAHDDRFHTYRNCRRVRRDAAVVEIRFTGNSPRLRLASEHPVMRADGSWAQASSLLPGDQCFRSGAPLTVLRVKPLKRHEDVFCMKVENACAFVVEGGAVIRQEIPNGAA